MHFKIHISRLNPILSHSMNKWNLNKIRPVPLAHRTPYITCGHIHKYQTQLSISTKLKKNCEWLLCRQRNFSHRRKSLVLKYLLQCHFQIFIQGRVMLNNNCVYFLAICANFSCKIEKFEVWVNLLKKENLW